MNVPVELIVWLLGANGAILTLGVHQLIRIMSKLSSISQETAVEKAGTRMRLDALERFYHTESGRHQTRTT